MKCGAQLPDEAEFCMKCGSKMDAEHGAKMTDVVSSKSEIEQSADGESAEMSDIVAHKSRVSQSVKGGGSGIMENVRGDGSQFGQASVGSIHIGDQKRECQGCGNTICSDNRSVPCSKCSTRFCEICEGYFRPERKRGENPLCKQCYESVPRIRTRITGKMAPPQIPDDELDIDRSQPGGSGLFSAKLAVPSNLNDDNYKDLKNLVGEIERNYSFGNFYFNLANRKGHITFKRLTSSESVWQDLGWFNKKWVKIEEHKLDLPFDIHLKDIHYISSKIKIALDKVEKVVFGNSWSITSSTGQVMELTKTWINKIEGFKIRVSDKLVIGSYCWFEVKPLYNQLEKIYNMYYDQ